MGRLTIFTFDSGTNFEFDLKDFISLSILRQLGLIIGILFLGFNAACHQLVTAVV